MKSKETKINIEASLGSANLWKAVKIANDCQQEDYPNIVSKSGEWAYEDKQKSAMFADTFEKKVKDITDTLRPNDNQMRETKKIHGHYNNEWINEEMVKVIMSGLKPKRCEGYDRIPLVFYKDGVDELTYIITVLMKKVVKYGIVPEQWKVAQIIPLHKKGKKNEAENYRPISNLCSVTKIFEKLILERINDIEKNEKCDLTGKAQHGFKKNCSTETAGI